MLRGEPWTVPTVLQRALPVTAGWGGSSSRLSPARGQAAHLHGGGAGSRGCPTALGGLWGSPTGEGSLLCGVLGFLAAAAHAGLAPRRVVLGAGCVRGRVGRCRSRLERSFPGSVPGDCAQHLRVGAVPLVGCWSVGVQATGTWAASGGFGVWGAAEQWGVPQGHPMPRRCEQVGQQLPPSQGGPTGPPVLTLLSASRCEMAAGSCLLLLLLLPWLLTASHSPPGCKIRITSKGLDLGKGLDGTLLLGPG